MEPKLERVVDELEIRQVLAWYCRGVDRLDEELVESCFWLPEAGSSSVFCGDFSGSPRDWVEFVFARMRSDLLTTHHLCQSVIAVEGTEAESESYFLARHAYREKDGVEHGVTVMAVAGRYLDRFEKRAGLWKIVRRTVVMDIRQFGREEASPSAVPIGRKEDDPSYELSFLTDNRRQRTR